MRLGFLLFLLLATGCATIKGTKQVLLVRSDPSGADIYENDKKIGTTPAFVKVDRNEHPILSLKLGTAPSENFNLKTEYRNGKAIWANLIWLYGAPIAWGLDWWNGSAYQIENPETLKLNARGSTNVAKENPTVVISPPDLDEDEWTDVFGKIAEDKLRAQKKWQIEPYQNTRMIFEKYNLLTQTENLEERNELFYELHSRRVFISKIIDLKNNKYLMSGHILDPLTGEKSDPVDWELEPFAERHKKELFRRFKWLPNTVFLNLSTASTTFKFDGIPYEAQYASDNGFTDQFLKYVNTINFTWLQRPRPDVQGHWRWNFFPSFYATKKNIEFNDILVADGVTFHRTAVSIGYGIEAGYQWKYGYPYVNASPVLNYTEIKFTAPQGNDRLSRASVGAVFELGYQYFFSDHFVGKVFSRSFSEDSTLWKEAFARSTGVKNLEMSATSLVAGISIGYYFPTSPKRKK